LRNVLAVDLGGTKCAAAIVDPEGRMIRRRTLPVDTRSAQAPVWQICELAKELAGCKQPKDVFRAAAIAVPGLVRPRGTVWAPNLPGWEHMPLAARLERALRIPAIIESDRNAAVIGESWRGAARGRSDVVVLLVGTGIGAGILSGGRLVRGAHELSGCAGWMAVGARRPRHGPPLPELESLAAGPAIARRARGLMRRGQRSILSKLDAKDLTALDVAEAAQKGDRLAREVFRQVGRLLGLAVANLVSLFDPEVVVIGGGLAASADLFLQELERVVFECAQPLAARQVRLKITRLGDRANLLGCARLAWSSGRPS
jgi:glucokinase